MTMIGQRSAIAVHHTATDDGTFDGPGNEARLSNDAGASVYRRAFAWVDPSEDEDTKAAYRFIHHMVASDGSVGAASLRACSSGIGVLNGGRGGTTIPDSDREGVWRHLAAHLRDGDQEPPDLRASGERHSMERRSWPLQELRVDRADGEAPAVSWYAAVFDSLSEDLGGFRERVNRRAFTKTLQEADIRALFNHDPNFALGRNKAGTLTLKVDYTGLRATVTPPDTQWAHDLLISIERGDINAGSFGFRVMQDRWSEEESGIVRELREIQLFDVSLVTYPAYTATEGTVALRSVFGDFAWDDLIHPILKARAGTPLDADDRGRFGARIEQLRRALPEPEPPPPAVGQPVSMAIRRRQLELLRLRGRT